MSGFDWDTIVLAPLMDTFALGINNNSRQTDGTVVFNPIKSQPGAPLYDGRGVWEATPYTVIEENQAPMVTTVYKIGLRLNDFSTPPSNGDQVTINGLTYTLDAFEYDGQGGVKWVVKAVAPGQETQYASTD
jgi:hypothetical protein